MRCRVCDSPVDTLALDLPAPAVTSDGRMLPLRTQVGACERCGHVQSPSLPNAAVFYADEYRISLQSEDHDQIYEVRDDGPIYRTDRQAELLALNVPMGPGARVLDYGAGKGATLRKLLRRRPDLHPFLFDVSDDYRASWRGWMDEADVATFAPPVAWNGTMDAVFTHYVLEHVDHLPTALAQVRDVLSRNGRFFASVPDWRRNTGDLLVVDHVNHFTEASLAALLSASGYVVERIDAALLPSAIVVIARPDGGGPRSLSPSPPLELDLFTSETVFWSTATEALSREAQGWGDRRIVIYGAGFYGVWLASRVAAPAPIALVDANPHLQGSNVSGYPVLGPEDPLVREADLVLVGLNPSHSRATATRIPFLNRAGVEVRHIADFVRPRSAT